ncbi:MAG TPA: DPP IV N-terminal domain-containing protein, partial [Gemmatimonadales bacterium]|nr:DPP IV N-terminal domain-containing protein [Gemmatimonadales bacterium]
MAARSSLALILIVLPVIAAAQEPMVVDIPNIMRGPETVGREPGQVRWTPDSRWIHFSWLPPGTDWRESARPYRIRAVAGATPEALSDSFADSIAPMLASGVESRDMRRRYVSSGGDLWVIELPTGTFRRLTRTTASEQVSGLSLDESRLYFQQGGNAYALTLASGAVEQLTDVRTGTAPDSARRTAPQRSALERDQRDLFGAIRDDMRADSIRKARSQRRDSLDIPVAWLGRDWRLQSLSLSPSGRHAVVIASHAASPEPKRTVVPNYVTASGFTEEIPSRTKVGDAQGKQRLGLLTVSTGRIEWVRPVPDDSSESYGSLMVRGWNDAGSAALLRAETRDYNRRVIVRLDTDSARVTTIDLLSDTAWVGGPCGFCLGWLPGDDGIWFSSEATGHAHLYRTDPMGRDRRALTAGNWEVLSASLSPDRKRFHLTTSEGSPFEQHFWTMGLDGSRRERL